MSASRILWHWPAFKAFELWRAVPKSNNILVNNLESWGLVQLSECERPFGFPGLYRSADQQRSCVSRAVESPRRAYRGARLWAHLWVCFWRWVCLLASLQRPFSDSLLLQLALWSAAGFPKKPFWFRFWFRRRWRFVTPFAFFGGFSFPFLINMYLLVQSCPRRTGIESRGVTRQSSERFRACGRSGSRRRLKKKKRKKVSGVCVCFRRYSRNYEASPFDTGGGGAAPGARASCCPKKRESGGQRESACVFLRPTDEGLLGVLAASPSSSSSSGMYAYVADRSELGPLRRSFTKPKRGLSIFCGAPIERHRPWASVDARWSERLDSAVGGSPLT